MTAHYLLFLRLFWWTLIKLRSFCRRGNLFNMMCVLTRLPCTNGIRIKIWKRWFLVDTKSYSTIFFGGSFCRRILEIHAKSCIPKKVPPMTISEIMFNVSETEAVQNAIMSSTKLAATNIQHAETVTFLKPIKRVRFSKSCSTPN